MKLAVVVALTMMVGLCTCKPGKSNTSAPDNMVGFLPHDFYECDPSKAKVQILLRTIQKEGIPGKRVQEFLNLPIDGILDKPITCISIKDLAINGAGGYVTTLSGGVGMNHVILNLISQVGSGLLFSVAAYTET